MDIKNITKYKNILLLLAFLVPISTNAFYITPDPAEFTSTSTIFEYGTAGGEYAVQFRHSGYAQQQLFTSSSNTGTLQSQSGGEPIGTLDIVFLNDDTARQYCVENFYTDCVANQSEFIIGQKQIVWLGASSTPTTTPPTATTSSTTINFDTASIVSAIASSSDKIGVSVSVLSFAIMFTGLLTALIMIRKK